MLETTCDLIFHPMKLRTNSAAKYASLLVVVPRLQKRLLEIH